MQIHIVKEGDTLYRIADQYGVSVERIITDNGLEAAYSLVVGQALIITFPRVTHIVGAGETLDTIAAQYGITEIRMLQNNPFLLNQDYLYEGQMLTITFRDEPSQEVWTNGYAYPYINRRILAETLLYMTTLTVFGYGFKADGTLIGIEDEELIRLAGQLDAGAVMLISSIDELGKFSNEHAQQVFADPAATDRLITEIINTMHTKGYIGLDIDFEFIANKEDYAGFVEQASKRLRAEGFTVNVDLAPKTSADQQGLLYESHDYGRIGAAADTVLLMTYEWGYTFGPPMAVAPVNQVRRVVEYALTEIPPEKILLGIPNYGYDWQLPFRRGITEAVVIGNEEAVRIAADNRAVIRFDETAMAPYFYYTDLMGNQHVVWFEDVRSIQAKLGLIAEYGLKGAGYWNLMRRFTGNWTVLNQTYNVVKRY